MTNEGSRLRGAEPSKSELQEAPINPIFRHARKMGLEGGPYQRETRRVARSRTSQILPELDARAWCRCEELHGQASRELTLRRR